MAAQVPSRLYRSRSQKMIAGVCGGLGEYFDVDPVLIRLMFVVTTFISGAGILAYIVLWIVVPFEGEDSARMDALRRDFDDLTGRVRQYIDPVRPEAAPASGPESRGGPDVSGYHGGFGAAPASPASPGSPANPFTVAASSRDASMSSDTVTARVPATDDPTTPPSGTAAHASDRVPSSAAGADLTEPKSAAPSASASSPIAASAPAADADDDPFRIDPPSSPPSEATGTPPFGFRAPQPGAPRPGSPVDSQASAGTPQFGAPYDPQGTPPGTSQPGAPQPGTPPFGTPFGAPAGGSASSYAWSSAPRDPGTASDAPFGATAAPPSDRKRRRQHWAGAILILIGTLILGNNLGLLWWLEFEYFFPLVLVGLGAWLLLGRGRRG
jgi:phage shock protein C